MAAASWTFDWWAWVLPSTLQATLLLALAWILDRLLVRRVWPELLASCWLLALARAFLPPDLSSPWSVTAPLAASALSAAEFTPAASALAAMFWIWLAGFAALVAVRAVRRRKLAARVMHADAPLAWRLALERAGRAIGLSRAPELATLEGLSTPAVFGLRRPLVLLPASWLSRAPTRRDEHALLHEAAHLRRAEAWRDEACALLKAALWFHPLAWIAAERLHALGELQADQLVVRALGSEAPSYRDTLVLAARRIALAPAPAGLRSFVASPSAIVLRIERLERAATRSLALARSGSAAIAVAFAACVLPMAPSAADLRAHARAIFAAEERGEHQSCFVLQAAATVLAADSKAPISDP